MRRSLTQSLQRLAPLGFALLMVVSLVVATPAQAQDAPGLATLSSVLSVHGAGQPDTLILYAELPQGTPLPATVSFAVPKGAKPEWVGEILGGDPSQDPSAKYTIVPGASYDVATVTLTKVPRGQMEISIPGKTATGPAEYSVSQPIIGPVGTSSISIQVPTGSKVSNLSSGLGKDGSSNGIDRYSLATPKPKVGTVLSAKLAATVAAASQGSQSQQAPASGQQAPSTGQQAQPAQPAPAQSAGFPWMPLIVVLSAVFFGYNLYRYRQVKAAERELAAGGSNHDAGHAVSKTAAAPPAGDSVDEASQTPDLSLELKALGDQRSRGELSREEYLARKKQLQSGHRGQLSS